MATSALADSSLKWQVPCQIAQPARSNPADSARKKGHFLPSKPNAIIIIFYYSTVFTKIMLTRVTQYIQYTLSSKTRQDLSLHDSIHA